LRCTTIMPQPTEITQFIFGQPLRRAIASLGFVGEDSREFCP
jgi:hypothetical protein